MKMSDDVTKIAPALCKAQKAIGGAVKRDGTNPHFRSKYATLEAVTEAVLVPLNENEISILQSAPELEAGAKSITVITRLLHTSGQWLESVCVMPVEKISAQGSGSAMTYGRRYGLMAMLGLAPEDDDGNAATANAPKTEDKPKPSPGKKGDKGGSGSGDAGKGEAAGYQPTPFISKIAKRITNAADLEALGAVGEFIAKRTLDDDERTYLQKVYKDHEKELKQSAA